MANETSLMAEISDDIGGYLIAIYRVHREDGNLGYSMAAISGHKKLEKKAGFAAFAETGALERDGSGLVEDTRDPAIHHTERMADGGDAIFGRTDDGEG